MKTDRVLPRALLLLAPVLVFACATGVTERSDPSQAVDDLHSWLQVMQIVGPTYDDVLVVEAGKDLDAMDLPRIVDEAKLAAAAVGLGHGRLRDPAVPAFPAYARQTERWFLQIAQAARSGQHTVLRKMIVSGKKRYCDNCHDAVERAQ